MMTGKNCSASRVATRAAQSLMALSQHVHRRMRLTEHVPLSDFQGKQNNSDDPAQPFCRLKIEGSGRAECSEEPPVIRSRLSELERAKVVAT